MRKSPLALALFAFALLVARLGECQPSAGKELSLADAVRMSLARNPDLRVESLNSAISEEDVNRSLGIYDPILQTGLFGQGSQEKKGSPVETLGRGAIGVTQLLPSGGTLSLVTDSNFTGAPKRRPKYDFASDVIATVTQPLQRNLGKEITESTLIIARFAHREALERFRGIAIDTLLTVVTSYNRLYNLRQAREARKGSLEVAQQLVQDTREKVEQKSLQPVDLANAEYGAAQRLKDVVDAERNVRDQEANLRYLLGLSEPGEIVPVDPPTRQEPERTQEESVKVALERRSDLIQLRSALETSKLQERISKNQTLPDVALLASAGLVGAGGTLADNVRQMEDYRSFWSAGIQLTTPLGNRAALADLRKAKLRTEQVRTQIDALSLRIRNDVETDLRALISARLQIRLSDTALAQAEQRLDEYRRNREAGTANTQDVLLAETDLSNAITSRLDAIEAYASAVLKLWRDTGELPERLGVQLDLTNPSEVIEKPGARFWDGALPGGPEGAAQEPRELLAAVGPLEPEDFRRVVRRLSRELPNPPEGRGESLPAPPAVQGVLEGLALLRGAEAVAGLRPGFLGLPERSGGRELLGISGEQGESARASLVRTSSEGARTQAGPGGAETSRTIRVTGESKGSGGRHRSFAVAAGRRSPRAPPGSSRAALRLAHSRPPLLPAKCHRTPSPSTAPADQGGVELLAYSRHSLRWVYPASARPLSRRAERASRQLWDCL